MTTRRADSRFAEQRVHLVRWIWAAPAVFLVHDAEEIATLAPWMRDHRAELPTAIRSFTDLTATRVEIAVCVLLITFLACTTVAVGRARRGQRSLPYLFMSGALVANGITHVCEAGAFRGYVPGLFTAIALVIPYGVGLGTQLRRSGLVSRRMWVGIVALGALLQVPIIFTTLAAVR